MVKKIRLQPRDLGILEHIARFHMTTMAVLHQQFFVGKGKDAVTSTLRRLRNAGYIETAELKPPRYFYYRLSNKSTQLLGLPESFAKPLGEQGLPTRYAVLRFCCLQGEYRQLYRPTEFSEEFPDCKSAKIPCEPYYLDGDGDAPRLAYIMVDLGAEAGRIVRKCRKVIGTRMQVAGFRSLIEDDAFLITVLTARDSKRDSILAAQARTKDFPHPIRVEAIQELGDVL